MNTCIVCRKTKPWGAFVKNPHMKSGYRNECCECRKKRDREYRRRNPEKHRAANKRRRQKAALRKHDLIVTRRYKKMHKEKQMWLHAKSRAKKVGVEFSISEEDIVIPTHCPVFGVELRYDRGRKNRNDSPSLDRIKPENGYTKDNIWVISYRANRIKNDATVGELKMLVKAIPTPPLEIPERPTHKQTKGKEEETIIEIREYIPTPQDE